MISNINDLVSSLSNKSKQIILESSYEYSYFNFLDYGEFTLIQTDDNDGRGLAEIQSEDWDGTTYLIPNSKLVDIINDSY